MNKFMKYSKGYRKAVLFFAIALASIVWIAITAIALTSPSTAFSFLGMNRTTTTMTLFYVPIITGVSIMAGINFWYVTENTITGRYGVSESEEQSIWQR